MSDNLPAVITDALAIVQDPDASLDDRGAMWALLHQIQLRVNRALKASRDDVILGMERAGLKALGPLTIKSTAVDPSYPCNAPENHEDAGVQDAMAELRANPATRAYVKAVPAHLEIDVLTLAHDVQMGVQSAIDLYRMLNEKRWRVEQARRLSLAVREVPEKKVA